MEREKQFWVCRIRHARRVGGAGQGRGRGSENVEEENVACCDDVEGFSWWLDSFRSASSLCSWNVSEATFSFFLVLFWFVCTLVCSWKN